ncbi:hypothetical protein LXL04_027377 [Taraxacum kok-saghyz]
MAESSVETNATPTTRPQARRLKGHKDIATCCIASRDRPGLIASSSEDGCICWFDMRCKDLLFTMDVAQNPISSLCFKPGNEDIIYVSSENEVKVLDVHMLASWKPLESFNYNKEEINQITCNSKSSFLAAADDGGDIKIIDIGQKCLYKTLRAAHQSICSSVQFLPWRPWEVITGGLDSKLIMWDFSKGRPFKVMDLGKSDPESSSSGSQCFNPAFVHAIAVPEVDMLERLDKICVVARGDGVVDVINIESQFKPRESGQSKSKEKSKSKSNGNHLSLNPEKQDENQRSRLRLDYSCGGHTAAVSAFSMFGEKGRYIISGGNDKTVKAWNLSRFSEVDQTNDFLHLNINLSRKVNWLCTTTTDSDNLVVCDTSKVVKSYLDFKVPDLQPFDYATGVQHFILLHLRCGFASVGRHERESEDVFLHELPRRLQSRRSVEEFQEAVKGCGCFHSKGLRVKKEIRFRQVPKGGEVKSLKQEEKSPKGFSKVVTSNSEAMKGQGDGNRESHGAQEMESGDAEELLLPEAQEFLDKGKGAWSAWFAKLGWWSPGFTISQRLASINIIGLPPNGWRSDVFSEIARLWGEVVVPESCALDKRNKDCGKVAIVTSHKEWINGKVTVSIEGVNSVVAVMESVVDTEALAPKFG